MQDLLKERLMQKKEEINENISFYQSQLDKENGKLELINEMLQEEEDDEAKEESADEEQPTDITPVETL